MATKIQLRRDTLTNWNTINPILSIGEIGVVTDSNPLKFKIGNGTSNWNTLAYDNDSLALKDLSNVSASDLDIRFRLTSAYKEVANLEDQNHNSVQSEFETNFYTENSSVNIATLNGSKVMIQYNLDSEDLIIQQTLPPASTSKYILVYIKKPSNILTAALEIMPTPGESINEKSDTLTFFQDGFVGLFIPISNEAKYRFISAKEMHDNNMTFKINDTDSFTSKTLGVESPIILKNTSGNAIIGLDPFALYNKVNKGFLAYFDRGVKIPTTTNEVRTTLVSPNRIFMSDDTVDYNSDNKSYTLNPAIDGVMSEFKICIRVDLKAPLVADVGVSLYGQVLPSYDYLKDYNGEVVYVHKDIAVDSMYEYIEILTVVQVDQPTEIQFILLDRVTDTAMEILDFNKGNSILAIERVESNSELSAAITSFEQMTMQSLRMVKKRYADIIDDFTGTKGITLAEEDVTAGSSFNYGNWTINFLDDAKLQIADGAIIMTAGSVEMFTSFQEVLDSESTLNLVGKTLKSNFKITGQANSYKVNMAYWTKERDKYDYKIIASVDSSGAITLMDGWQLSSEELYISQPDDQSVPIEYNKDFVVPNDAVNIAFILRPVLDSATNSITVIEANISISEPYSRWQITSPQQANEQEIRQNPDLYKFQCHGKMVNDSDEYYEIPGPATQIAVGEKVSGGNDIEIIRGTGTSYYDIHCNGKIKFKKDGFASITYYEIAGQGTLPAGVDTVDLEFWWAKDTDGTIENAVKVPNSSIIRTLHRGGANDWGSGGKTVHEFWAKFGMEVTAGDTFYILGKSNHDSPNAAVAFYEGNINIDYSEDKYVKIQLERAINSLDILKNAYRVTQAAIDNGVYSNLDYVGSPPKPALFAAKGTVTP